MGNTIYVNTKGLRNSTKPRISSGISNLSFARECLSNISMPDNFSSSSQLKNIPSRIQQVEKNVAGINSYIESKSKEFDEAEARNKRLASSLGTSLMSGMLNSSITNTKNNIVLSVLQSAAVVKSKQTNQNWIGLRLGNKNYGFYVDKDGNVVKNSNINGVEFGKNGKAVDETQFNMMLRAVNKEVPKGTYTDFGNNIPINQNVRVLVDDNDSKYGILVKNEKKEWEFLYYGDCINGRNPAVRSREGEYLTCGKYKGQGFNEKYPYFELEPSKENPRAEVRTFLLSYI